MVKARKISQVFFILFFILLFIRARYPYEVDLQSDLFLRFSPLMPLFDFIDKLSIDLIFWPALIIILLTLFLGRFFCGWICPLGTTLDAGSKILKSPSNRKTQKWQKLTYLKFVIFFGLIILAIFSLHFWGYFDPLSIFNRALTVVFYPLATFFTDYVLIGISKIPFLEDPAYAVYDVFKSNIMPEAQANYQQLFWIALFIAAIIGAEKLTRRFWCRYLCPAGAWLGFLSQFRFYERIVGEECPSCNLCQKECKMNAIPEGDVKKTDKVECIECFNYGATCPDKYNAITYRWRWKPYHTPIDYNRRQFMFTTAASIGAIGLLNIGLKDRKAETKTIRPPGALPEDDFMDRCIRCLECVRICESNGGCLQPDHIHNNLAELWLPVAVMREGYCAYDCNLCGQVCPTDAILPLELTQKQKTPMGLAHFNKNLCIPYARNEDCIVCEEHCPTPDKAIKFEVKDFSAPDGSVRKVKYPYVVKDLCIGCGICETKCPLAGEAGIFVTPDNQKRLTKDQMGTEPEEPVETYDSPYG
jgi:polyferredoxin/ferredoxin